MEGLFVSINDTSLSAEMMINLFRFDLSPQESSKRVSEECVIQYWNEFLLDLENGMITKLSLIMLADLIVFLTVATKVIGLEAECEKTVTLRLEDVLIFVTGSDSIPPMGFEYIPEITFLHKPSSHLPTSNTCSPTLHLPVLDSQSYHTFRGAMIEALVGGVMFGQI